MLCSGVEGHADPRRYFANAIAGGRLSHAYLLVGPAGVGKARFATELAAALLCHRPAADAGACDECRSCRTIATGNHAHLTLLEPATGKRLEIDAVRGCLEEVALRGGGRHVVRIRDAERMSPAASNALLKTLEEPPPGVVFFVVTAQPAQIQDTIHSRCQRVPFGALAEAEFERVLGREGRDPRVVPGLWAATRGSPGAAMALLDGIAACGGPDRLRQLLAGTGRERPESLVDYVPARAREAKRDRVRRLLELIRDGMWAEDTARSAGPEAAETVMHRARRVLRVDELLRDLDANVSPELVLEEVALVLAR